MTLTGTFSTSDSRRVAVTVMGVSSILESPQPGCPDSICAQASSKPPAFDDGASFDYSFEYWKKMEAAAAHGKPGGMEKLLVRIHKQFPKLKFGYFNPPKENF